MTIRSDIRAALIAAITPAVTPVPVVGPRDWPEKPDRLPMVILQSPPHERAQALVKGPPSYETRAIFPVTIRVAKQTIADADAALEALIEQVKVGIFQWLPFQQLVEQIASVETRTVITSEGAYQIGEAVILLECEFPEFYSPAPGAALTEFQGTVADQTTGETLETFDLHL